ncbi:MAG: acyl-CoA dehydrogenase family protein [Firmicutes bacterium]|nr:acyl-CoA dehydrogenase family protein [Bacillota bacterium]
MVSGFSDTHLELRKVVTEVAAREFAPRAAAREKSETFPRDHMKRLADLGFLGITIPEALGGPGADLYSFLITAEALARSCAATAFAYVIQEAAAAAILVGGTDEIKKQYLPGMAKGDVIGATAGTEASGGSTPLAFESFAAKTDDGYRLNGRKVFISGAGEADLYVIVAKTDREKGIGGISAFALDKGTGGLSFGKKEDKMGLGAVPAREIIFEDSPIKPSRLLGQEGGGVPVLMAFAGIAALGAAAIAVGIGQAALDQSIRYAKERVILGKPIATIQATQYKIADMFAAVEGARSLLYRAAYQRISGPPGPPAPVFAAKITATEAALRVADAAIQIHGAYGYSREFPVERYYREARALSIHFGINEVLRENLGKILLGLM